MYVYNIPNVATTHSLRLSTDDINVFVNDDDAPTLFVRHKSFKVDKNLYGWFQKLYSLKENLFHFSFQ